MKTFKCLNTKCRKSTTQPEVFCTFICYISGKEG